ncbi:hypothetical protein Brsp05_03539 [Brucella sp. NBRC 12953]|uniref:hypothetical protein n=1 Tax=Brucella sp. NBRC 12953 TaxID=3075481 RepID=UPI0030A2C8DA
MLGHDPIARDLIASALGKTIDAAVREHIAGLTQEAPLTARIGQMLESELNGKDILGNHIRIMTQDIPDRGQGALEKDIGADLYVGIEVVGGGGRRESKGFLVQAKLQRNLNRAEGELRDACAKLLGITDASYVFVYGTGGVRVLNAKTVFEDTQMRVRDMSARRVTTLFKRTLECTEGDFGLGLPRAKGLAQARGALADKLKALRVERAIEVKIETNA